MSFRDKVAIVTASAGAGIGQATVRAFSEAGAKVVISSRRIKRVSQVTEDIRAHGGEAIGLECDVTNLDHIKNIVQTTLDKWGRIDILVNNAARQTNSQIVDMTDEIWNQAYETCLRGTFWCCREVLPIMISQGYGRIINFSSGTTVQGSPDGDTHYNAAKSGIQALTKGLSREVARYGITVNCISPGLIWNDFLAKVGYSEEKWEEWRKAIPVQRAGSPEEVAALVLFLASNDANFITGQNIQINGGSIVI
ncbi:SDR family NAD(P)-dependent oxidoreductase [Chloroflexota bacterium]